MRLRNRDYFDVTSGGASSGDAPAGDATSGDVTGDAQVAAASAASGRFGRSLAVCHNCVSATTRWITELHHVREASPSLRENGPMCVGREQLPS